jgi:hypothetical protein
MITQWYHHKVNLQKISHCNLPKRRLKWKETKEITVSWGNNSEVDCVVIGMFQDLMFDP